MTREREHQLAVAFDNYVSPSKSSYDPDFVERLRELRPDWFLDKCARQQLLELAASGSPCPTRTNEHSLYTSLARYGSPNSSKFDPEFAEALKEVAPSWLSFRNVNSSSKKESILRMARKGEDRPTVHTEIGSALSCYTRQSSGAYDPEFDAEIRALRPDWFLGAKSAQETKSKLLSMAVSGDPVPTWDGSRKLRAALYRYTTSHTESYDSDFNAEIRALRPDWFR